MKVDSVVAIEEVKSDIDAAEQFYHSKESGIGAYFRDCIIADIESLRLYAGIHAKHFGVYRMFSSRFPFAIYYDIKDETAIVVAVIDMRRHPALIKRKLRERKFQDNF